MKLIGIAFYIDDQKTSFRNKVKLKFNLMALNNMNNSKEKNKVNSPYISILPSSILAKLPKGVNEISKFFSRKTPLLMSIKSHMLKHSLMVLILTVLTQQEKL